MATENASDGERIQDWGFLFQGAWCLGRDSGPWQRVREYAGKMHAISTTTQTWPRLQLTQPMPGTGWSCCCIWLVLLASALVLDKESLRASDTLRRQMLILLPSWQNYVRRTDNVWNLCRSTLDTELTANSLSSFSPTSRMYPKPTACGISQCVSKILHSLLGCCFLNSPLFACRNAVCKYNVRSFTEGPHRWNRKAKETLQHFSSLIRLLFATECVSSTLACNFCIGAAEMSTRLEVLWKIPRLF